MNLRFKKIYAVMLMVMGLSCGSATLYAAGQQQFTVVLDAGHGGHDSGAAENGVKEKDINLAVALATGKLIENNLKNVKVVYTRSDDTFRTLQERANIANSAKGNLFISVHTNSVDKSSKNRNTVAGAQVYALGLHKDANNMSVARRENSVIELEKNYQEKYSGFDPNKDESYIIFEMAQKGNLARSVKFAGEVEKQLVNVAGRKDRGVHQAGFWVLWATSMPSVLVELDFICNPESATYMNSDKGVAQMSQAIFNAVKSYVAGNTTQSVTPSPKQVALEKERKAKIAAKNTKSEKTEKTGKKNTPTAVAADSDGVVLAVAPEISEAPKHVYHTPDGNGVQERRRRSKASRKISEAQTHETIRI